MSAHGMVEGFEAIIGQIAGAGLAAGRQQAQLTRLSQSAHQAAAAYNSANSIAGQWKARAMAAEARAAKAEAVAVELLDDAEESRKLIAKLQATIDELTA